MTATESTEVSRHLRGSSILLAGRLLAMVIALGTQVLIVRVLTKVDYGVFAFGLTLVSSFRVLVSFGDSQSIGRFLTLETEAGDRSGFDGTLAVVLAKILVASTVALGLTVVFIDRFTDAFLDPTSDSTVVMIVILLAPLEAIGAAIGAIFAVFDQVRMVLLRKYLYAPVVRFGVVGILALTGGGVRTLALGYLFGEILGLLLYIAVARRAVDRLGPRPPSGTVITAARPRLGPYLRFSLPAGTVEMVGIVMTSFTVILLGWWHGPEAVAEFRSVFPFGRLNQMVLLTFSVLFAPMATRFFARNDRQGMESAYWQTSAYLMVLSFPIFVLSVPLASSVVPVIFGEQYAVAAPALAVLGTAYFMHSAFGYNALVLQIHGHVRWALVANLVAMATAIALSFVLIPSGGPVAVSWSIFGGLAAQNLVNHVGLRRHLGFGWVHPVILRVSALSVVVALVLAGLAETDAPLAVLLVGAAVGALFVLRVSRRSLDVHAVFPEIAKLPVVGKLVS